MYRFFPNQIESATQILNAFSENKRQVLLAAQMQSGKSGVFLYVICRMLIDRLISYAVILCGSNETELYDQMKMNWTNAVHEFVQLEGLRDEDAIDKIAALTGRVRILKSKGADSLDTSKPIERKTLVVWDESHFAQQIDNLPYKFLTDSGLSVTGTKESDEKWLAKNCYFLSVSATPFAEFSDVHNEEYRSAITRAVVHHKPDETLYRGVKFYKERGAIRASFSLKTNVARFAAILTRFKTTRKYALVRTKNMEILKELCRREGVAFKEYTGKRKEIAGIHELATAPATFAVIGLNGMCRMGKEVPKQHIGFAFEEATGSKTDCILQSFLGRLCGHGPWDDTIPEIYVPESFTQPHHKFKYSELDRYIQFSEGSAIVPAKGACMGKMPEKSGKLVLEAKRIPLLADAEEYDETDLIRDADSDAARRTLFSKKAHEYISRNPYVDPIQQREVLQYLTQPSTIEVHNMNSASYEYVREPTTGLTATLGERWDDHWNAGKHLKFYYRDDQLYLVGYTENASDSVKKECCCAIVPTTKTEAFNPRHDNPSMDTISIIHDSTELSQLSTKLLTAGEHTVFIHKSLRGDTFVRELDSQSKTIKARGRNWPRSATEVKKDFIKIVIIIDITVLRSRR